MTNVPAGIFRAYDIRGIVGDDLTEDVARLVGGAFGTKVRRAGGRRVLIGRDGRLSSPTLAQAMTQGIRSTGCTVVDAGMVPTPITYFGLNRLEVDGGVQVTGSHNPPDYNGFKMSLGTRTLFDDAIQELRHIIEAGDFASGRGDREEVDLLDPYLEAMEERVELERPVRLAVDAGNGVAGPVAPRLYRELGCEVEELYCEVDGRFPNHHPDPTEEENLEDLREAVDEGSHEVGFGFDGDADRIGVIDEEGEIVWGDRLLVILARDLLERHPGAKVIFDVKCSKVLADDIRARGGEPIMWRTGHSLIKQKMREEGALLAGEMSGHLFFSENFFGHDDAIYAGAKLLEILSRQQGPFSELLADLPETFSTPEIRRPSTEEAKFEACDRLREELSADHDVIDIDGVRVNFADGWGLARPSNTQPVIVLRFEAESAERLEEIREFVESRLRRIEEELGVAGEAGG